MVRHRKPVRGGKSKFSHNDRPIKKKKEKFNYRTSSYIRDRKFQNQEIEDHRQRVEERKQRKRHISDDESSEEDIEVNPLTSLLSTFRQQEKTRAIYSDSESDEVEEEEEQEEGKVSDGEQVPDEVDEENEDELGESVEEEEADLLEDEEDSEESEEDMEDEIEGQGSDEEFVYEEDKEFDAETAREDAGEVFDPFAIHFRHDLDDDLYKVISSATVNQSTHNLNWPVLGNLICQIPTADSDGTKNKRPRLLDNTVYAKSGTVPKIASRLIWDDFFVHPQIQQNIPRANKKNMDKNPSKKQSPVTGLQKELFSIINNYQDLLYTERTFANAEEIRFIYCLHAVNHVLKTRTRILHHNAKIRSTGRENEMAPEEFRDQGLVRPKVLIVVQFKDACLKIVQNIISILFGKSKGGSVMKKKRFTADFSGDTRKMPKKNPKPEDYEQMFKGNADDSFKIGLSITKKTLKLYTDFYSSDIIIASPIGLRRIIGAEGESNRDHDFLASVEVLIMDQPEVFMMQNWDHVLHLLNHIHLQPKSSHDADFSRLRSWCANGWTKYYRQTLIFSSLQFPEINAIFNKHCRNYAGKVKTANTSTSGSISQVVVQLPLTFQRMDIASHVDALNTRLEFFTTKILPHYKDTLMNHCMIFIPSYFDFVALRNYFRNEDLSFVQVCEYGKPGSVAKARDMFFHSSAHFMLYTERAHFHFRYRIKGIRHLIFYAPPLFPHFYSEMCNLMQEGYQNPRAGTPSNMSVSMLFSKYDMLQLSAIVGMERAQKMLRSEKHVHMLMTKE